MSTSEDTETKVLRQFPLQVDLELTCSGLATEIVSVRLSFCYMSTLEIVTVKGSTVESVSASSIAAG